MLDTLCLTGEVGWARLSAPAVEATQVVRPPRSRCSCGSMRSRGQRCCAQSGVIDVAQPSGCSAAVGRPEGLRYQTRRRPLTDGSISCSETAQRVLDHLRARGASFEHELSGASGNDETAVRAALRDLVAAGLVASDGFGGLRSIIRSSSGARAPRDGGRASPGAGRLLRDAEAGSDTQSASSCRPGRCSSATASSSGACSRAKRTSRRGASWRASIAGSRRAAKFAAAASSPACPANSSRWRRRRAPARNSPHAAARPVPGDQRGRSAQPRRYRHRRRPRAGRAANRLRLPRRRPAGSARRRLRATIGRGRPGDRLGRGARAHRESGACRWSAVLSGGSHASQRRLEQWS